MKSVIKGNENGTSQQKKNQKGIYISFLQRFVLAFDWPSLANLSLYLQCQMLLIQDLICNGCIG